MTRKPGKTGEKGRPGTSGNLVVILKYRVPVWRSRGPKRGSFYPPFWTTTCETPFLTKKDEKWVGTPIYLNTRNCNFRTSTTEGKHPEKGSDLRTPKIVVF